ncbi:hypothetical protein BO94DRAFT_543211 [Aspergillus sclerotioniger CBS 115572]|uniref:Uncharacterized protein n=1 Tax=Aspergillus sclerotioniger CBS 115572 TaxID=1450535 RepID=A0A317X6Y1_9EURO|nr:hypothetical protein BO94DRAFT_543211 [Aspergillus sclerotioniger CBS 115572]PWY93931.1 hypothetical protein BO94DRAFT_543211 [Aspergillus sclerotioniger CBS 115572]
MCRLQRHLFVPSLHLILFLFLDLVDKMLLKRPVSLILATATLYGQCTATSNKSPALVQRVSPLEGGVLEKRDTCSDGSRSGRGGCTGEATRITIHTPYITVAETTGSVTVPAITTSEPEIITSSSSSASRTAVSSSETGLTTSSDMSVSTSSTSSTSASSSTTNPSSSSASATSISRNTETASTSAIQTLSANSAPEMTTLDTSWLVALGALLFY